MGSAVDDSAYLGQSVRKYFEGYGWYDGKVTKLEEEDNGLVLFTVYYHQDGDQEQLERDELLKVLVKDSQSNEETEDLPTDTTLAVSPGTEGRPSRRARRVVNYNYDSSEDEFANERKEKPQKKKQKRSKNTKKSQSQDNDSEFEQNETLSMVESESDDDSFHETPAKKKRKASSSKKGKFSGEHPSGDVNKIGKKSMVESCDPINAPPHFRLSLQEIKENHTYLDSCGVEATDGIIDRLVGDMIDKIGSLAQRALENSNGTANLGSEKCPLKLGTACSGTDAPALALTLVNEQMRLRKLGTDHNKLFFNEHVFSCENEAFKSAYLARNFDSTLYPDIAHLCDNPPLDVYGRPQAIGDFNLFVAGTSCKNFSMLRSNKRIDIEDKGCSGETFIAAIELLFKEKPRYAIFENVIGAPWEKMSEYITGRIKLSSSSSSKAIKDIKTAEKSKDLTFVLEDGNIIVDYVPGYFGVRCGSIVKGFVKGNTNTIHKVTFPTKNNNNTCSLTALMKSNGILREKDTMVFETGVTYSTRHMKVDTKRFGLPQTRARVYMFVWQPEKEGNINDDLGDYWEAIVRHLESPVRHSLESFVLQPDHDIIRVFREALNGPSGRTSKRETFLEPDFWTSTGANLKYSTIMRDKSGIEPMARSLTSWGPFGKKQLPPHYWLEYGNLLSQRQLDMIEILHTWAARDAESHDSSFSSHFWNISQNVGKEKHRGAVSGIAGCITPGGEVLLPHAGRPLLGSEKLMIQGIPYFRLLLGNETEVQLGDLAGNAMSLTVVCATMLGAMLCGQLRQECLQNNLSARNVLAKNAGLPTVGLEERLDRDIALAATANITSKEIPCLVDILKKFALLAKEAVNSSIWCTSESSGTTSRLAKFLLCDICNVSCCRNNVHSTAGIQLYSHVMSEVHIPPKDHDHGSFMSKLRSEAPPTLIFDQEGFDALSKIKNDFYRVKDLDKLFFNLHSVRRDRKRWLLIYYARSDAGTGEPVASFTIVIGEIERRGRHEKSALGVLGEFTSFLPAKLPPLVYGEMLPCANITILSDSVEEKVEWQHKLLPDLVSLTVVGESESLSFRAELGLTTDAAEALLATSKTSHKTRFVHAARKRGEIRRWTYADNWKVWPDKISISGNDERAAMLYGDYERAACRQTVNQSALWIKSGSGKKAPLYLLLQPNVSRNGPDQAVISTSISHHDASSIVATFPTNWQPCDALTTRLQSVEGVLLSLWSTLKGMKCRIPPNKVKAMAPFIPDTTTLAVINGLGNSEIAILMGEKLGSSGNANVIRLNLHQGQRAQQLVRVFNSVCVAPLLQYDAQRNLNYDLGPHTEWIDYRPSPEDPLLGCDYDIVPKRPTETWIYNKEREAWDRRTDPGAARNYFTQLNMALKTFTFDLVPNEKKLIIKCHPNVAAHTVAGMLTEGRGIDIHQSVSVKYHLSDSVHQSDPVLDQFRVSNCNALDTTNIQLKEPYELYDRQKRAVTKCAMIEDEATEFEEIEMVDHAMPGSAGWSLISRASRKSKICGGVIADAIGAGKTVISIALIVRGIKKARASRVSPNKSSATLIIVPPGLIDQWKREVEKFTNGLRVVCIYDAHALKKVTVNEILGADIVISSIDVLQDGDNQYLDNLLKIAKSNKKAVKSIRLPAYAGQVEKTKAKGVWIPATSQDPYGGGNSPLSQGRRNETAYYTYVYNTAIRKCRTIKFSESTKGVPLEYFEWERLIVDEIHESLCTTKGEIDSESTFKEKNRRAGRELLGITEKDPKKRPLIFRRAVFGLTGTPLLDHCNRVIELANLMGGTYVIGLSSHWRKLERESRRDIFLGSYLEPRQTREIRRSMYEKCQEYLDTACCRNKSGEEMKGIELLQHTRKVSMSKEEGDLYKKSQSGIPSNQRSFAIQPADFNVTAGHDISKFLRQNASLACRGKALLIFCQEILKENPTTKIVVFADGRIGAGDAARMHLCSEDGPGCTWLDQEDSVAERNRKISWYQSGDSTEEDRARPRVLLLHFEHAAGLNLQTECNHLILFSPLYVGTGGTSGDAVADASTELQAIGRVHRPGQQKKNVYLYRIEVCGPDDEECLDRQLIRRNTDKETVAMAVNAAD